MELFLLIGAGVAMFIWIVLAIPPDPPPDKPCPPGIGANLDYIPAWRRHTVRLEVWTRPLPEPPCGLERVRLN